MALGFWEIILIPWPVRPDGNVIVCLGTLGDLRWGLALPEWGLATPERSILWVRVGAMGDVWGCCRLRSPLDNQSCLCNGATMENAVT